MNKRQLQTIIIDFMRVYIARMNIKQFYNERFETCDECIERNIKHINQLNYSQLIEYAREHNII